jgi:hypothetical protein
VEIAGSTTICRVKRLFLTADSGAFCEDSEQREACGSIAIVFANI